MNLDTQNNSSPLEIEKGTHFRDKISREAWASFYKHLLGILFVSALAGKSNLMAETERKQNGTTLSLEIMTQIMTQLNTSETKNQHTQRDTNKKQQRQQNKHNNYEQNTHKQK